MKVSPQGVMSCDKASYSPGLWDRNLALVPRLGPEINSRACLWVSPRPRQLAQCWLTNQRLSFCISRLDTPRAGSGPRNPIAEPPLAS